jgi:hypothetical protein
MTKIYNLKNLQPGDRLVLPKGNLGFVQHHAIYIGNDAYGNRQYIENYIGKGVQMVNETYLFRDGYHLTRIERVCKLNCVSPSIIAVPRGGNN